MNLSKTPQLHILFDIEIDELRDEPSGTLRLTYDPSNKRVLRLLRFVQKELLYIDSEQSTNEQI